MRLSSFLFQITAVPADPRVLILGGVGSVSSRHLIFELWSGKKESIRLLSYASSQCSWRQSISHVVSSSCAYNRFDFSPSMFSVAIIIFCLGLSLAGLHLKNEVLAFVDVFLQSGMLAHHCVASGVYSWLCCHDREER